MDYDYNLSDSLIAHEPATPRDASRLFVYDTLADTVTLVTFAELAAFLPADSILVLNNTRVAPARLALSKSTGGLVKILFLLNEWNGHQSHTIGNSDQPSSVIIHGLPDKGIEIGETLFLNADNNRMPVIKALSHSGSEFTFELLVSPHEFEKLCNEYGETPLPPYIKSTLNEKERRERYQTTFAKSASFTADNNSNALQTADLRTHDSHASNSNHSDVHTNGIASVAAPTASLHFTSRVFESLKKKKIEPVEITLHVGRGTFSPVHDEAIKNNSLHAEPFLIDSNASHKIAKGKRDGKMIIAAGTTVMRTLESPASEILDSNSNKAIRGQTKLFIHPPYDFKIANALITNFHLPNTSLLMLLDAFLQFKGAKRSWKELYEIAIQEKFRFYSFGDAMLIV